MFCGIMREEIRNGGCLTTTPPLTTKKEQASWTLSPILPQFPSRRAVSAGARNRSHRSIGHAIIAASTGFAVFAKRAGQNESAGGAWKILPLKSENVPAVQRRIALRGKRSICALIFAPNDTRNGTSGVTRRGGIPLHISLMKSAADKPHDTSKRASLMQSVFTARRVARLLCTPRINAARLLFVRFQVISQLVIGRGPSNTSMAAVRYAIARRGCGTPSQPIIGYPSRTPIVRGQCRLTSCHSAIKTAGATITKAANTLSNGWLRRSACDVLVRYWSASMLSLNGSRSNACA
jgi:hypothetical protein